MCFLSVTMVPVSGLMNVMAKTNSQTSSVNDVLAEQMAKADAGEEEKDSAEDEDSGKEKGDAEKEGSSKDAEDPQYEDEDIDVDLTVLSSTMVYSEVYNMMVSPESYIGKTVKMEGAFACFLDEAANKYYYACIIQDATACCAQGIEFVPPERYKFPDDFPEGSEEITVTGVFDTYEEGDYKYCTLRKAVFEIV